MPVRAEHRGKAGLGDDHAVIVPGPAGQRVRLVRVHGDGGVAGERPRPRGPGEQVGATQARVRSVRQGRQPQPDDDAGVHGRPAHAGMAEVLGRQGRLAARAVRCDPVVALEQARLEQPAQRPPDGLDITSVHRGVGSLRLPAAQPGGQIRERLCMSHRGLAAAGVEPADAVGLDVGAPRQTELPFDSDLDGQAVAADARAASCREALHRLQPLIGVPERLRWYVVHSGQPGRGLRLAPAGPRRRACGPGQRAAGNRRRRPAGTYLVLDGGQIGRDLRARSRRARSARVSWSA